MRKLNEILQDIIEQTNSENPDEDVLQALYQELNGKVNDIYYVIRKLSQDIEYEKKVIEKYKRLVANKEKSVEYLKGVLLDLYKRGDVKHIIDEDGVILHTLHSRKSYTLMIENIDAIPQEFVKIEKHVDKNALKEYISKGNSVEGAFIQENEYLVIK